MTDTAQILVNIFDGTRQPLPAEVKWLLRISDGRSPSERKTFTRGFANSSSVKVDVPFFDNLFDDYTVLISPDGYEDSGWQPVLVNPKAPAEVDVLALPSSRDLNFANATWMKLGAARANVAKIIQRGCANAEAADQNYGVVMESRPAALACFLNITTALSQLTLPSKKSPLDYYWNLAWPGGDSRTSGWVSQLDSIFKQDRFFCYVEESILPDIRSGVQAKLFAPEQNPGSFHGGATESYKQIQFDVSNVQLTFHGGDTATFKHDDGTPVQCVKIEPDIDYFKDLVNHGLLEVFPNFLTHGLTQPDIAFALRWMAARRAGLPDFDPLFTVQDAAVRVAGAGVT